MTNFERRYTKILDFQTAEMRMLAEHFAMSGVCVCVCVCSTKCYQYFTTAPDLDKASQTLTDLRLGLTILPYLTINLR